MKLFCVFHCESNNAYKVYENIDSVKSVWDSLLPEGHHLHSQNLKLMETVNPEFVQFKYLILEDEKSKPIGCVYLQMLNFNSNHYNNEILNRPKLEKIKNHILKQSTNLLICGNLFRINFQGFYFSNSAFESRLFSVLKHFAKKNQYKINFCGLLVKDCNVNFSDSILKNNRYKYLPEDITMQIEILPEWKTFDDYKVTLSRKYLQRANKIKKSREVLEVRELTLEQIIQDKTRIEELYLNIASKQSIKMGLLNGSYFFEMKKLLGDNFVLTGYFFEGKMVGFSTYIFENENMEIHYIGFDYEYNEKCKLYFNILFDGLETAILKGKKQLELGRTAREAKASLGAKPLYINNFVWVKLGIPTLVYKYFYKWYNQNIGDEWKSRNPFKTPVETLHATSK